VQQAAAGTACLDKVAAHMAPVAEAPDASQVHSRPALAPAALAARRDVVVREGVGAASEVHSLEAVRTHPPLHLQRTAAEAAGTRMAAQDPGAGGAQALVHTCEGQERVHSPDVVHQGVGKLGADHHTPAGVVAAVAAAHTSRVAAVAALLPAAAVRTVSTVAAGTAAVVVGIAGVVHRERGRKGMTMVVVAQGVGGARALVGTVPLRAPHCSAGTGSHQVARHWGL
jgi:hypothetical protein